MLANIIGCRDADGKGGHFNYGGYCNPKIDALDDKILVETDTAKRDAMIARGLQDRHEEAGVIPLHQQALVWGVSSKVKIVQRADNQILFYWVENEVGRECRANGERCATCARTIRHCFAIRHSRRSTMLASPSAACSKRSW